MILTIAAIEQANMLADIQKRVAALQWRDGRSTAGARAKQVKHNEQAVLTGSSGKALQEQLCAIIGDNTVVKAAARPRRMSRVMISKTQGGGHYGAHVDNAMMQLDGEQMRSDLSFTLFLSQPDDYDGGELVIHSAGMTSKIKAEAGQLVLYPSSSIHEVRPVTKGARIVCVGWIESLIADPTQRETLFDLENLRAAMRQSGAAEAQRLTLDKTIANLLRMWAKP